METTPTVFEIRGIGVRSPVATNPRNYKRRWQLLFQTLGNRCECHVPWRWPLYTKLLCDSRCGTLKNSHCSMAMSAEHRSKREGLHSKWWRLPMREKFSSGTKKTPYQRVKISSAKFLCPHPPNLKFMRGWGCLLNWLNFLRPIQKTDFASLIHSRQVGKMEYHRRATTVLN